MTRIISFTGRRTARRKKVNDQDHHDEARQHQQQVAQHQVPGDGVQGGPGNRENQAADRLALRMMVVLMIHALRFSFQCSPDLRSGL
jgi:ribonuclease HI